LAENTIEERILLLQEHKAALGKGVHSKLSEAEKKKARRDELRSLFEL